MTNTGRFSRQWIPALISLTLAAVLAGCGPKAWRGGPGTENPQLDEPAMSVTLDRKDIEYLVSENIKAFTQSAIWNETIIRADAPPFVAIWPIQNATTQHIEDQASAILSSIEMHLVNSGRIRMVSRERQAELVAELKLRQSDIYDPATAGRLGRQLGAQYFVTGRITSVDERFKGTHRLQYSLVLQVIEVETGLIRFQNEAIRSKALHG
jgi:PBP1b-binding outer membrane lipoprotein LpoB